MSNEEMKPCPFCGGDGKLIEDKTYEAPDCGGQYLDSEFYCQCIQKDCGFTRMPGWGTIAYPTKNAAIKAWNTRAQDEKLAEVEEALINASMVFFNLFNSDPKSPNDWKFHFDETVAALATIKSMRK